MTPTIRSRLAAKDVPPFGEFFHDRKVVFGSANPTLVTDNFTWYHLLGSGRGGAWSTNSRYGLELLFVNGGGVSADAELASRAEKNPGKESEEGDDVGTFDEEEHDNKTSVLMRSLKKLCQEEEKASAILDTFSSKAFPGDSSTASSETGGCCATTRALPEDPRWESPANALHQQAREKQQPRLKHDPSLLRAAMQSMRSEKVPTVSRSEVMRKLQHTPQRARYNAFQHQGAYVPTWVWPGYRFGGTETELRDGRRVFIAGEHEDYYDPDFCIYNDVIVEDKSGKERIFTYPPEVFPPTDGHVAIRIEGASSRGEGAHDERTSVVCGEQILILRKEGGTYSRERRWSEETVSDDTPRSQDYSPFRVFVLNVDGGNPFSIHSRETTVAKSMPENLKNLLKELLSKGSRTNQFSSTSSGFEYVARFCLTFSAEEQEPTAPEDAGGRDWTQVDGEDPVGPATSSCSPYIQLTLTGAAERDPSGSSVSSSGCQDFSQRLAEICGDAAEKRNFQLCLRKWEWQFV